MRTVYFTICARNYLAYAMTLRASLLAADPEAEFLVFLADAPLEGTNPFDGIVTLDALDLPNLPDMTFRYALMEFSTAIKPFCFQHIFDVLGAQAAVYLDPDIQVFSPLAEVTEALAQGADSVLTPHILTPLADDDYRPNVHDLHRSGTFNLGFAAFANTAGARNFLSWWAGRCRTECTNDLQGGYFVDQKFAELAPSFLDKLHVLRHPGYNVAYWNLANRPVKRIGTDQWHVRGKPLRFFHFSGIVPEDPSVFSKHQNRFDISSIGAVGDLLQAYHAALKAHDHLTYAGVAYAYDHFGDGVRIPLAARRIYARQIANGTCLEPFVPKYNHLNMPSPRVDQMSAAPITVLMEEIWKMRPDLQAAFPLGLRSGRRRFHRWFVEQAPVELGLDPVFVMPARAGLGGAVIDLGRTVYRQLPAKAQNDLKQKWTGERGKKNE